MRRKNGSSWVPQENKNDSSLTPKKSTRSLNLYMGHIEGFVIISLRFSGPTPRRDILNNILENDSTVHTLTPEKIIALRARDLLKISLINRLKKTPMSMP